MSDDLSILNTLARKKLAKIEPPAERPNNDAVLAGLLSAEREKRLEAERGRDAILDASAQQSARDRAEIDSLKAELAASRERESAALARPVETIQAAPQAPAHPDYEERIAEISDLRVKVASLEAERTAQGRMETQLKLQITERDNRIRALIQEARDEEKSPEYQDTGCEIDVLRDGGDKIRSLRVRYV